MSAAATVSFFPTSFARIRNFAVYSRTRSTCLNGHVNVSSSAAILRTRVSMQPCNFFEGVPSGCRAYVMKHIIHDWDDEQSRAILANCRKAVPV